MPRQPVAKERIWHAHPDGLAVVPHQRRGLEPGVEDVTIDLGLDAGEDLFPDGADGRHDGLLARAELISGTFAPGKPLCYWLFTIR